MKSLICFHKDEQFIFSDDYLLLECTSTQSVTAFLLDIESRFFNNLKIVQLNFEFDQENLFSEQTELYHSAKASVFVLNKYALKSLSEIKVALQINTLCSKINFSSLISKDEFVEKTKYVIEQIKTGRIYQANLTAPLVANLTANASDLFFHFHPEFNGQHKALLPLGEIDLHCFSPELFLQQIDGTLITRPIKGSLNENDDFGTYLFKNEKENAELSMIVDLLRNDLNALSDEHSSVVKFHREKMQLGYIQHTYSEIAVQSDAPLSYVLEKTFPGGSISGCPKIESLHVIREVEPYKRQAYTGSLGWWQGNDFCLNIVIRSLIQTKDQLYYHAGCGIVYDSDPEAEWKEFLLKTGALHVR